jgi:hypothetical protein
MENSTAVNWIVYRVYKEGCGEPDTTFGYYTSRSRADMECLKHASDPMCKHEKISVDEIEVES